MAKLKAGVERESFKDKDPNTEEIKATNFKDLVIWRFESSSLCT